MSLFLIFEDHNSGWSHITHVDLARFEGPPPPFLEGGGVERYMQPYFFTIVSGGNFKDTLENKF